MPHGTPDYGPAALGKTVHPIADMAELAARLGSIHTFDRRGNVIFMDDFESGIEKWYCYGSAGGLYSWSASKPAGGGFSLRLYTDNDEDDYMAASHFEAFPVLSRMGFQCSFLPVQTIKSLWWRLYVDDLVESVVGEIGWDYATNILSYLGSDGEMHNLSPEKTLKLTASFFYTTKLVVDFNADKYVKLIINDSVYDLSDYSLGHQDTGLLPRLACDMGVYNAGEGWAEMHIDNAILTQNEP